jgi:hypothetical protein
MKCFKKDTTCYIICPTGNYNKSRLSAGFVRAHRLVFRPKVSFSCNPLSYRNSGICNKFHFLP